MWGAEEKLCGHRWQKSAAELDLMRQSASLAANSLARCMQLTRPGVDEHFLGATFGAGECMQVSQAEAYVRGELGSHKCLHLANSPLQKVLGIATELFLRCGCSSSSCSSTVCLHSPMAKLSLTANI